MGRPMKPNKKAVARLSRNQKGIKGKTVEYKFKMEYDKEITISDVATSVMPSPWRTIAVRIPAFDLIRRRAIHISHACLAKSVPPIRKGTPSPTRRGIDQSNRLPRVLCKFSPGISPAASSSPRMQRTNKPELADNMPK